MRKTMTRLAKLISALEFEARAHQQLVNIGEELRTVYSAGERPDDDEMLRLRQAHEALVRAADAVVAAAHDSVPVMPERSLAGARRGAALIWRQ
jgi:hypothetical protein